MGAHKVRPVLVVGVLVAALLIAGCRGAGGAGNRPGFNIIKGDNAAPIAGEAVATQPVEQLSVPEGQANDGLSAPDGAGGVEPSGIPVSDIEVVSVSDEGEYYVAVSYAREYSQPDGLPAPPAGHKWVVVVATLSNQGGGELEVGADDLTLIDQNEVRYTAEPADEVTRPALVGASLSPDEKILGEVRFAIPTDVTALLLEWCPHEPCSQPLTSSIP